MNGLVQTRGVLLNESRDRRTNKKKNPSIKVTWHHGRVFNLCELPDAAVAAVLGWGEPNSG